MKLDRLLTSYALHMLMQKPDWDILGSSHPSLFSVATPLCDIHSALSSIMSTTSSTGSIAGSILSRQNTVSSTTTNADSTSDGPFQKSGSTSHLGYDFKLSTDTPACSEGSSAPWPSEPRLKPPPGFAWSSCLQTGRSANVWGGWGARIPYYLAASDHSAKGQHGREERIPA